MGKSFDTQMRIINHLSNFGPATSGQIHRLFFSGKDESYRNKKLKELVDNDVLDRISINCLRNRVEANVLTDHLGDVSEKGYLSKRSKLPDTMDYVNLSGSGKIYFIAKSKSYLMSDYKEKNSLELLGHQLVVNDVYKALNEVIEDKYICSDSGYLSSKDSSYDLLGPVPDILVNKNGVNIAIEVELTTKKSARYRKKAEEYDYSDFDLVLYYCSSQRVIGDLQENFKTNKSMYFCSILSPDRFNRLGERTQNLRQIMFDIGVYDGK